LFFCYGREGRGDLVKAESGWRRGSNKWGGVMSRMDARWEYGEVEQPRALSERSHSPCSLSLSISVCLKGRKKKNQNKWGRQKCWSGLFHYFYSSWAVNHYTTAHLGSWLYHLLLLLAFPVVLILNS